MRLKLVMRFAYPYEYSIEIIVAFTVESQVSPDDERYLYIENIFLTCDKQTNKLITFHMIPPIQSRELINRW